MQRLGTKAGLIALMTALSGAAWATEAPSYESSKLGQEQYKELEKFRAQYEKALNGRDFKALGKMFSENAVAEAPDGRRMVGRDQIVSGIESMSTGAAARSHSRFEINSVRPLGKDMALVTVSERIEGAQPGTPNQIDIVSLTEKEHGKWKVLDYRAFPARGTEQTGIGGAGMGGRAVQGPASAETTGEPGIGGSEPQRRAEIERLNNNFESAWNDHDPAAMGRLWSPQAVLVEPNGQKFTGKDQIVPRMAGREEQTPRSSFAIEDMRMLRDDLAVVSVRQKVNEPQPGMPAQFDVVGVVKKEGPDWKIVDARVFAAPGPEHREGVGGAGSQGIEHRVAPGSKTPQVPDGTEKQPGSGPEP
jgi:uncharacterized protein (TIGR02246 family)